MPATRATAGVAEAESPIAPAATSASMKFFIVVAFPVNQFLRPVFLLWRAGESESCGDGKTGAQTKSVERPFQFMLRVSWLPPLTRLPAAMMPMAVEAVRLIIERLGVPVMAMMPGMMTAAIPTRRPAMMMAAHINFVRVHRGGGRTGGDTRACGGRGNREADRSGGSNRKD